MCDAPAFGCVQKPPVLGVSFAKGCLSKQALPCCCLNQGKILLFDGHLTVLTSHDVLSQLLKLL